LRVLRIEPDRGGQIILGLAEIAAGLARQFASQPIGGGVPAVERNGAIEIGECLAQVARNPRTGVGPDHQRRGAIAARSRAVVDGHAADGNEPLRSGLAGGHAIDDGPSAEADPAAARARPKPSAQARSEGAESVNDRARWGVPDMTSRTPR